VTVVVVIQIIFYIIITKTINSYLDSIKEFVHNIGTFHNSVVKKWPTKSATLQTNC
jgi:hypothetical protein